VNPARAFGPALVSGQWVGHLVYWVGPMVGGVLAALLWEYVLLREEKPVG
jgi:glycerol uptake facilitator-like aquaporin